MNSTVKLEQDTPQGPYIAEFACRLIMSTLWSHILSSPHKINMLIPLGMIINVYFRLSYQQTRPKVNQLHYGFIRLKEHVLRLQISVCNFTIVELFNCQKNLVKRVFGLHMVQETKWPRFCPKLNVLWSCFQPLEIFHEKIKTELVRKSCDQFDKPLWMCLFMKLK